MEASGDFEFHDASVAALRREGGAVVLELDGFLHTSVGRLGDVRHLCWWVGCRLRFERGEVLEGEAAAADLDDVWRGDLWLGEQRRPSVVSVPLDWAGPVRLELSGAAVPLVIVGQGLHTELLGPPTGPEWFPR